MVSKGFSPLKQDLFFKSLYFVQIFKGKKPSFNKNLFFSLINVIIINLNASEMWTELLPWLKREK